MDSHVPSVACHPATKPVSDLELGSSAPWCLQSHVRQPSTEGQASVPPQHIATGHAWVHVHALPKQLGGKEVKAL
jgi:hypothetical protein